MTAVVAYVPCNDMKEDIRDAFWKLEIATEEFNPGEKLCVMADLRGYMRDRVGGRDRWVWDPRYVQMTMVKGYVDCVNQQA